MNRIFCVLNRIVTFPTTLGNTNNLKSTEFVSFWATVCKTVRPMLLDCCPVCLSVCLSVTLVYCQCRINRGAGGAPAPVPLSLGPHNFTVMIFTHMIPKLKTVNFTHIEFYSAPLCKRCTTYGNSVCLSVCPSHVGSV